MGLGAFTEQGLVSYKVEELPLTLTGWLQNLSWEHWKPEMLKPSACSGLLHLSPLFSELSKSQYWLFFPIYTRASISQSHLLCSIDPMKIQLRPVQYQKGNYERGRISKGKEATAASWSQPEPLWVSLGSLGAIHTHYIHSWTQVSSAQARIWRDPARSASMST